MKMKMNKKEKEKKIDTRQSFEFLFLLCFRRNKHLEESRILFFHVRHNALVYTLATNCFHRFLNTETFVTVHKYKLNLSRIAY